MLDMYSCSRIHTQTRRCRGCHTLIVWVAWPTWGRIGQSCAPLGLVAWPQWFRFGVRKGRVGCMGCSSCPGEAWPMGRHGGRIVPSCAPLGLVAGPQWFHVRPMCDRWRLHVAPPFFSARLRSRQTWPSRTSSTARPILQNCTRCHGQRPVARSPSPWSGPRRRLQVCLPPLAVPR